MKKILEWVKNDWANNRFVFIMETINFLAGVLACGYIAISAPNTNWIMAYIFYCINSFSGILFSIKRKSLSLPGTKIK